MKGWSGLDDHMVDRVTRKTHYIDRVCIGLLGSTQPGPFSAYMRQQVKEGGGDGLIQRFGMLVWPDLDQDWTKIDRHPNKAARDAAFAVFEQFANLFPLLCTPNTTSTATSLPALRCRSTSGVRQVARTVGARLAWRRRRGARPPGRAHGQIPQVGPGFALICHLAGGGTGRIGLPAINRALAMAAYFESHARRAYGAGTAAEADAARAILGRIRNGGLKDGFTARNIYRAQRAGLSNRETVAAALDLLDDLGWIKGAKTDRVDATGKPSIAYTINPKAR